jgi:hypothetical protein
MRIGRIALDFLHRGVRVLERDDDRSLEPRLRDQPFVQDPFIHRVAHGGAEFAVLERLPVFAGRVQDAQDAVVLV